MLASLAKSSAETVTRYLFGAGGTWLLGGLVIELSVRSAAGSQYQHDAEKDNAEKYFAFHL